MLSAADEILRPLLIVALHTGLRRSELFALTWQDVDVKQEVIRVVHTKNGERREIPMTDTLRATVQQLPRRLASDYVFPGKTGRGLVDVRKRFRRALQEAGIEGFVFHDLRHTFASHLVMAGVALVTVKEFLGHKDLKMTLRYAHLAPTINGLPAPDWTPLWTPGMKKGLRTMPQPFDLLGAGHGSRTRDLRLGKARQILCFQEFTW
jgi:integrase